MYSVTIPTFPNHVRSYLARKRLEPHESRQVSSLNVAKNKKPHSAEPGSKAGAKHSSGAHGSRAIEREPVEIRGNLASYLRHALRLFSPSLIPVGEMRRNGVTSILTFLAHFPNRSRPFRRPALTRAGEHWWHRSASRARTRRSRRQGRQTRRRRKSSGRSSHS